MNDDILLKNRLIKEKNETIDLLKKKLHPQSDESEMQRQI